VRPKRPSEELAAASPLFGKAHARNRGLPFGSHLRATCADRGTEGRLVVD
jgi:hypothetical protein